MPGLESRALMLLTLLLFTVAVFAADKNFVKEEYNQDTYHNACERLLDANLSGFFVVKNLKTNGAQLVQLKRLGNNSAYIIANAKLDLGASGIRELEFSRTNYGWYIGDEAQPHKAVNVMSIQREGNGVKFTFQDVADAENFTYEANPNDQDIMAQGDILNPDELTLHFDRGMIADVHLTRVKLDRTFELIVSQSLKSLLATKVDPENDGGWNDYVIMVEMKMPLTVDEAEDVLGTKVIYPIATTSGNEPAYRYAVPKSLFGLLESVGKWIRKSQIAHIDAVPASILDRNLVQKLANQVKRAAQNPPPAKGQEAGGTSSASAQLRETSVGFGSQESPRPQEAESHEPSTIAGGKK